MVKKTVDDLYREIDTVRNINLVSNVTFAARRISRNICVEVIDINFNLAIDSEKILDVYEYIEKTYSKDNQLVEHMELRSSHCIQLEVIRKA